jgi:multisubunit Na+/H+ antiporter MnhG subunit
MTEIISKIKELFQRDVSPEQSKETGIVFAIISLIICYFGGDKKFLIIAIIMLLLCILWGNIYKPLAIVWFSFSNIIGHFMSRIILSVIFFGLVTPVGVVRKIFSIDSLKLSNWKKGKESVFKVRDNLYMPKDLKNPY